MIAKRDSESIKKKTRTGVDGPAKNVARIAVATTSSPPASQAGAMENDIEIFVGPSLQDDRASRKENFAKGARAADACALQGLVASAAAGAKPQAVTATSRMEAIRARMKQQAALAASSSCAASSGEHRSV